ncbi:MAG: hypothetical protein ACK41C_13400 [Phenylobacterium sp.]|uniref:hypothetical protein n=1 Tax=Phenylobacterium sp. TaxID=1871053 RepID=UPI00391C5365
MDELARLLLLLGFAGVVVTLGGSAVIWFMAEERRLRRALAKVLGAKPDAVVLALGRGRGAGLALQSGRAAVAWDSGGWCLVYRLDEIAGAEILLDGEVVARAYRDEPRRALDRATEVAGQVTLRLVFDDPAHPDFDLDLWVAGDEARRAGASPRAALQEANRWLARIEAILRRPGVPRAAPAVAARPAPPPEPEPQRDDFEDAFEEDEGPPWDEDDDNDGDAPGR